MTRGSLMLITSWTNRNTDMDYVSSINLGLALSQLTQVRFLGLYLKQNEKVDIPSLQNIMIGIIKYKQLLSLTLDVRKCNFDYNVLKPLYQLCLIHFSPTLQNLSLWIGK